MPVLRALHRLAQSLDRAGRYADARDFHVRLPRQVVTVESHAFRQRQLYSRLGS